MIVIVCDLQFLVSISSETHTVFNLIVALSCDTRKTCLLVRRCVATGVGGEGCEHT